MVQDIQQLFANGFSAPSIKKMENDVEGIYQKISQAALQVPCERIPQTIANKEADELSGYVSQCKADMQALVPQMLDQCGISRSREQVIWISAMSKVPMPKLAFCKAPPMKRRPAAPAAGAKEKEKYQTADKIFTASALATGVGVAFLISGHALIVPSVAMTAAGVGGMVYSSKAKQNSGYLTSDQTRKQALQQDVALGASAVAAGVGAGLLSLSSIPAVPVAAAEAVETAAAASSTLLTDLLGYGLLAAGVGGATVAKVKQRQFDLLVDQETVDKAASAAPDAKEIVAFVGGVIRSQMQMNVGILKEWISAVSTALVQECKSLLDRQ